jgi:transcriptional regulator with XRE-family HTH domain
MSDVLSGADLRRLRRRAGRTQRWVADAVGIPVTVVSAYERGQRQPGVEVATRIVAALGHRIELVPMLDPEVQARRLEDVLTLAEALPFRARPLAVARR